MTRFVSSRAHAVLFLVAVLLLAPESLRAQSANLSGTVVDAQTSLALPGARVRIDGLDRGAITGQNGRFVITGVPSGTHRLTVTYLGYAEATRSVEIARGVANTVQFALEPRAIELGGVTVVGQRSGQARALNQQLASPNITNVVAADQIGRFPDANIGDAMKRIPGINVMYDQGEARFGLIRGTEPRLNSVMINGERVPSAEAEVREVQLDLIPSDMVAAIEVNKALTPDMDADAIGGSVDIVTRAAPVGRRLSATLGSGYNFLAEEPMGIVSAVYSDRFADGRLGVVLSGSYFDHKLGSDNIEAVWDRAGATAFVEEFDVRRYDVQRVRRSLAGSFDLQLAPGSALTLRTMYNHRDDWENRYRLRYALDAPDATGIQEATVRRQTKGGIDNSRIRNTRLEDQRVHSHSLSGEHLFGRIGADWSVSYGRASESRPDERYIEWQVEEVPVRADTSDPRKPSFEALEPAALTTDRFGFRRIEDQNGWTREEDVNGRIDFTVPLAADSETSSLQFGARLRLKEKLRDNDYARVSPMNGGFESLAGVAHADYSDAAYLAGDYPVGDFATREFLGRLPLHDPASFRYQDRPDEYLPGNYTAEERITAGYAMLTQELSSRFSATLGLRIENSDIRYDGYEFNEDDDAIAATTGSDNYTSILPGLHMRYEFSPRTVFRAAWTNTLSRPNYYDLVPYRVVSFEDNTLAVGNPDLDPTMAMNFDLMAEHYFQSVGLVSGGVFYKDIRDFIFSYSRNNLVDPVTGNEFRRITQPQNGSNADLWGAEIAFQRQLDFLPGVWSGFGVYANYTLTNSRIRGLNVEGREAERLALPGTAQHTGNFSLSYDSERLSLRGSVNYQDDFLDPGGVGEDAFYDRHYDHAVHVDLNASFTITPQMRVFMEANNLTNQPLRYYQGVRSRMMQEEFYDRRFTLGLKYDL